MSTISCQDFCDVEQKLKYLFKLSPIDLHKSLSLQTITLINLKVNNYDEKICGYLQILQEINSGNHTLWKC
jgi:hypothetical protein